MKNKIALTGLFLTILFYAISAELIAKTKYKKLISFSSNYNSRDSFAEVIKFRADNLRLHEVWHVLTNKLNFVSTVYLSGGNIKGVAVFKSTGYFEISNDRDISITYQTTQRTSGNIESDILSLSSIHAYITQAGRNGIENQNTIRTIYNDPNMKIVQRYQLDEFIMYSHSASK